MLVRRRIDEAMQNPTVAPVPLTVERLHALLDGFTQSLLDEAHVISTPLATSVEAVTQAAADDIARTRDPEAGDAMSSFGLLPSTHTIQVVLASTLNGRSNVPGGKERKE